jgi:hypothetical protein
VSMLWHADVSLLSASNIHARTDEVEGSQSLLTFSLLTLLTFSLNSPLNSCHDRCTVDYGTRQGWLSQDPFQQAFAEKSTATAAWDTMLGFHVPCCINQGPTPNVCKRYVESALNAWLNWRNITTWRPP